MSIQQISPNTVNIETKYEAGANALALKENFLVEKKFCKGDIFPISLEAKGDVFQLAPTNLGTVRITHDIFVQATEENLLFSLDGEKWSEFTDIFTGSFGFSANIAEDSPVLNGLLVANLREAS